MYGSKWVKYKMKRNKNFSRSKRSKRLGKMEQIMTKLDRRICEVSVS